MSWPRRFSQNLKPPKSPLKFLPDSNLRPRPFLGVTKGSHPSHQHQNKLVDCKICHDAFPQEKGAIEQLKKAGKLKPKHVMNKQCTKCHKEKRRAGEKTGPITCKQCHIK